MFLLPHPPVTVLYLLFTRCTVSGKADSRDNYCVEGRADIIDMRHLREKDGVVKNVFSSKKEKLFVKVSQMFNVMTAASALRAVTHESEPDRQRQ